MMSLFCWKILALFLVYTVSVNCQNIDEMGHAFEGDIVGFADAFGTRSGVKDKRFRWPNATVPYKFDSTYPQSLRQQFLRATEHISKQTCIRFVPHSTERDYLHVVAKDWCWSYVGRIGNGQEISLPPVCNRLGGLGTFIHEIIHALGFHHEQSRTDRDENVTILWKNIKKGAEGNFEKYSEAKVSPFRVTYDYGSIMHYSRKAFSKNGKDTIVPLQPGVEIGQRRGMSQKDVAKLNNMYCKNE